MNVWLYAAITFLSGIASAISAALVYRRQTRHARNDGFREAMRVVNEVLLDRAEFEMAEGEGSSPQRWDRVRTLREVRNEVFDKLRAALLSL